MNASNMNIWSVSSTVDTTSNPPSVEECLSAFGESVCGEPLIAQHILLDFNPSDKWDNEFVQKKCCAFWHLIDRCPELQNLKVLPDPVNFEDNSETNVDMSTNEWLPEANKPQETAVTTLESIGRKGLIDNIFIPKADNALCEDEVRNHENSTVTVTHEKYDRETRIASRNSKKTSEQVHLPSLFSSTRSSLDTQLLCKYLRDWDKKHSK